MRSELEKAEDEFVAAVEDAMNKMKAVIEGECKNVLCSILLVTRSNLTLLLHFQILDH